MLPSVDAASCGAGGEAADWGEKQMGGPLEAAWNRTVLIDLVFRVGDLSGSAAQSVVERMRCGGSEGPGPVTLLSLGSGVLASGLCRSRE